MKPLTPERQAEIKAIVELTRNLPPAMRDAIIAAVKRDIIDMQHMLVEEILAEKPIPDFLEKIGKPRSE